ncbi:long-chain fatty acid--CoA ligase [Mycolicibacter virginiensis]|uniref:Long-chain fatty acid--CoA ligase n=1 Tax=Mycolicibacter virginiensis TaxID=1795032 RepID=A0A9X7IR00_9MYCO|nr:MULTISPECIES: class I adenylate-forming enzyme family protein [Mycolicibacter]OBJ30545.1 AMP-binding protein [Mycolicibacter heraklionensis]PQM53548.1 long-chain fatty acid--CoA ligase [Mycolicibacter virginiensis]
MSEVLTVDTVVRSRASADPAKPAVIDPNNRLSYLDLEVSSRELAAVFVQAGIGKGSRVGLIMPNGVDWVRIAVAVTRIGAVLVPLSTLLTPPELAAQLRVASVQFLISVEEFRGRRYLDGLPEDLASLQRIWVSEQVAGAVAEAGPTRIVDALTATVTPADLMLIMFTSGSSGPPKGVLHSHGSALGAVASGLAARCIDVDTRLYLPMPFFWVGGFGGGVLSALLAGATLITEESPTPETTLRLLESERVTLFRGWPDQAEALARHAGATDLSALRPGSLEALLPPGLRAAPGARANLFGMTEAFGPYCGYAADTDLPPSAWGSCGKPFAGMEVRIVDADTGAAVPPDTVGMIQLRGPHTLRGICGRTREDVFTVDGFYPTGDLGRLDRDGFLFYHGRADDMFKVSGATVYPSEVEKALRSIAGVAAAVVTNVPDGERNRVGAMVAGDGLTIDALRSRCRDLLSSFKVPAVWLVVSGPDAIPHGPTGKVDKRHVRDMLTAGYPADTGVNQQRRERI